MPIDMSAAVKAPPRKATPRKSAATTPAKVSSGPQKTQNELREEGLNGLAQLIQLGCIAGKQHADAAAIGMHFPPLAKEVANLADSYDQVAAPIDFLIKFGPFSAVIAAGMPLVLQVLANHKIVDAGALAGQGVVPPEVLESQMRAQVAQIQAQAMADQQRAIAEAQAAERHYASMLAEQNGGTSTS
jgi:hypothetical protein